MHRLNLQCPNPLISKVPPPKVVTLRLPNRWSMRPRSKKHRRRGGSHPPNPELPEQFFSQVGNVEDFSSRERRWASISEILEAAQNFRQQGRSDWMPRCTFIRRCGGGVWTCMVGVSEVTRRRPPSALVARPSLNPCRGEPPSACYQPLARHASRQVYLFAGLWPVCSRRGLIPITAGSPM